MSESVATTTNQAVVVAGRIEKPKMNNIIRKEFQRLVCLVAFDIVTDEKDRKKGGASSKNDSSTTDDVTLIDRCGQLFHGTKEDCPLVEMLVKGLGKFKCAFEQSTDCVTDPRSRSNKHMNIKSQLLNGNIILKEEFNVDVLSRTTQTGSTPITARTCFNHAKTAIKNIRKANAIADMFLDKSTKKIPSGKNLDDLFQFVLAGMWILLDKGKTKELSEEKMNSCPPSQQEIEDHVGTVKDFWIFQGWMGFVLYGSHEGTDPNDRLSVLCTSDSDLPPNEDASRKGSRKRNLEKKAVARQNSLASGSNVRGTSAEEQIKNRSLDQTDYSNKLRKLESALLSRQQSSQRLQENIKIALQMAQIFCPQPDENNKHWKNVFSLIKDQKVMEEEVDRLTNEVQCFQSNDDKKMPATTETEKGDPQESAQDSVDNNEPPVQSFMVQRSRSPLDRAPSPFTAASSFFEGDNNIDEEDSDNDIHELEDLTNIEKI